MNAEGLALGEKLRKFKQESMGLSPPLRGNMITNSAWIRMAHNSFARYAHLRSPTKAPPTNISQQTDRSAECGPQSAKRSGKKKKKGQSIERQAEKDQV
jgi:ubiquitin carboxyl-terminal hydrolase L5